MERGPPACGTPSPGCGGGRGHGPPPSVGPGGGSLGLYPRWRLLRHALEHLVYPVIFDHHCGDTRGGGGGGGGVAPYPSPPPPPPSSLQPHRCLVPRARVWDPYPIGCGMVGCPPPAARCGWLDGEMGVGRTPPPRCGTADESNRSRMGNDPVGGATSGPHGIARCSVVLWGGL